MTRRKINPENNLEDSPKINVTADSYRNDAAKGGRNPGGPAMLQIGGDVANVLDWLDFIDVDEERTQIKITHVLQHIVPLIKFRDVNLEDTIKIK